MNPLPIAIALTLLVIGASTHAADEPVGQVSQIALQRGLVMVSVLRWDQGDRENIVTIEQQTANGVTYRWNARQPGLDGKPQQLEFRRYVRSVDLAKATRLHSAYWVGDQTDYPGYTGWSLSTGVYDTLAAQGEAPYMIVNIDRQQTGTEAVIGGLLRQTKRLKGVLRRASKQPAAFPLLYNGARVSVPVLRVSGRFTADDVVEDVELWVLADRAHPLLLKSIVGKDVWQMVRIETPQDPPARTLEQQLATNCRAELPGIYFGFATAELDTQSDRTLAAIAQVLGNHSDWSVSIEGHTDNIGSDAANATLSQARANAVRTSLVKRYSIEAGRLNAVGFGEMRPRESNETFEGRARNRRVELVRPCASGS